MSGCGRNGGSFRFKSIWVLPLSLIFAALGFSYSLATVPPDAPPPARRIGSREVGKALRFTNPFLLPLSDFEFIAGGDAPEDPKGFDLGDACPGATITRYVNAAGGFLPYTFSATPSAGTTPDSIPFIPPPRLVFGKLVTTIPAINTSTIPPLVGSLLGLGSGIPSNFKLGLRFDVVLSDYISDPRLGRFRINLVDCPIGTFRFAQDRLPNGQVGNSYFTSLQTLGPAQNTVTFSVIPNSVLIGTGGVARLEDTGLKLAPDGTLFGRPIKPLPIQFKAQATSTGLPSAATSRDGTDLGGQTFIIPVDTTDPLRTEVAAVKVSIKGTQHAAGEATTKPDTLSYSGILDAKGESTASLAGSTDIPFVFRVNNGVFTANFDAKGKIKAFLDPLTGTPLGAGQTSAVSLTGSYNQKSGKFALQLKGADLLAALGDGIITSVQNGVPVDNNTIQPLILAFEVGNFRTCEVLSAETLVRGGVYNMNFVLGTRGFNRAGVFQITHVDGRDFKPGTDKEGDLWHVYFMAVPGQDAATTPSGKAAFGVPSANATILSATKLSVRIGSGYTQDMDLTLFDKQNMLSFKADTPSSAPGIVHTRVSGKKFLTTMQINNLLTTDTGIQPAIKTKDLTIFPLGADFKKDTTVLFSGETGRVIAPDRGKWSHQ